jgi:isocitrate dehydrogenase (NAD+)
MKLTALRVSLVVMFMRLSTKAGLQLRYASASPTAAFAGQKGTNVRGILFLSVENPRNIVLLQGKYKVTLIPGDGTFGLECRIVLIDCLTRIPLGIGPEISESVKDIYTAAGVRIVFF